MLPRNLDESVRFACKSCTACCDQPWNTLIESDKARVLDDHDFSAYPQLAGETEYYDTKTDKEEFFRLAKGEGTRCLFLDTDGLCIIHKELGAEAKPHMCRQFPYLTSHTWVDDRVSASYGCPAVQGREGPPLTDQADAVAEMIPPTQRAAKPEAPVPLDAKSSLTQAENDALFERATAMFDDRNDADIWSSFGELLTLLVAVREHKSVGDHGNDGTDSLVDLLRSDRMLLDTPDLPEILAYPTPSQSPMKARFLFAATLYPDTVPADTLTSMGIVKRLTLMPKLMALGTLTGTYASRLLHRNIPIADVMAHEVDEEFDEGTTQLLRRYYRSRLWQRFPAGTRLNVMAGVHQHIQDLNAIMFLARAEAHHTSVSRLTEAIVGNALKGVEFHLANQARLYDHTLKGWFRTQLRDLGLAFASLRLMALKPSPESAETTESAET